MPCNCTSCQALLSTGKTQPSHHLISRITNSEVFKCDDCGTYLLRENAIWERLEPPSPAHTPAPSLAAQLYQPYLMS